LTRLTAVERPPPGRRYSISGSGYATEGVIKRVAGEPDVPLDQFMLPMMLASDAVVHDGELIGDPTEGALVVLAEKGGLDPEETRATFPRVADLPFDAAYKLMATFHRMEDESGREVIRCFVKGAPDQLLARSTHALDWDLKSIDADDAFRKRYLDENQRLGEQGLRVLATARRDFDPATFDPNADLLTLMDDLTVLALVGIVDPPRPQAKAAIAEAKSAGIQVRMITGDHAVTAEAIAKQLGIEGRAITGAEWAAMSDDEALAAIDGIGVIARVTPEDKVRLVDTLKRRGHVVAMTGDGVNDAPALKRADIGIAMGITGTEVSKEAAAMILTDDDFSTIVKAVRIGRGLYDNLKKYIQFQMGALIGFIVTFLGASIFNIVSGVAVVPLQAVGVHFTTQVFQAIGLGYGEPAHDLMERKPRPEKEPILDRPTLAWLVVAGLVMGGTTLGIIGWADDHHDTAIARTMGMTTFAIANVVLSYTVKDPLESLFTFNAFADLRLLKMTGLSALAILFGTELGIFQRILGTVSLTGREWIVCILGGATILVASEIQKLILRRRSAQSADRGAPAEALPVGEPTTPSDQPLATGHSMAKESAPMPNVDEELVSLIKATDSVELKLTVPEPAQLSTARALGLDPLQAQLRQVFFFETPDLALDKVGLVVRARRSQKKGDDSVVKLRPVVPAELPKALRRSQSFGVELDASPAGYVVSGSLKGTPEAGEVREAMLGNRPVRRLFSKGQQELFAEHAPAGVALDDLSMLGPLL